MTDEDFRDAFHRHKAVVHRFAYRMTGSSSTAEDIVQDCFLILWRKPKAYDAGRGSPKWAWYRCCCSRPPPCT